MPNVDPCTLSLQHVTQRRYARVSHTPVMEVSVTYPVLSLEPFGGKDNFFSAAAARFNEAYRAAAENFAEWGMGAPAEEARAAFAEAGMAAAYTFDRRLLICRMEASVEGERLVVRRAVLLTCRRGTVASRRQDAVDRWRIADLSLLRPTDLAKKRSNRTENTALFW